MSSVYVYTMCACMEDVILLAAAVISNFQQLATNKLVFYISSCSLKYLFVLGLNIEYFINNV